MRRFKVVLRGIFLVFYVPYLTLVYMANLVVEAWGTLGEAWRLPD